MTLVVTNPCTPAGPARFRPEANPGHTPAFSLTGYDNRVPAAQSKASPFETGQDYFCSQNVRFPRNVSTPMALEGMVSFLYMTAT